MKVTGYQLREALRRWKTRVDITAKQFNASLFQFPGSNARSPIEIAEDYERAEHAVARLEEVQQAYNALIKVTVMGNEMTLARAVKLVGNASRLEKMWRSAAGDTGRDRYGYGRELTRKADDIVAQRVVSESDSLDLAEKHARYCSALREAIASATGKELDMTVEESLFK